MASSRYRAFPQFISHPEYFDHLVYSEEIEWDRSNEEMIKNLGKAIYDMILLNTAVEQEQSITWN